MDLDSYNEPFGHLRKYMQRRVGICIIRNEKGRIRQIIGRKKGSTLADAVAAGIILKETLQNPRYDESKYEIMEE